MTKIPKAGIITITVALVAFAATPAESNGGGGWWRGRDTPTTSPLFPNPGSTAMSTLTGQVFDLDFQWGGGGGFAGSATIEMRDPATGDLVHTNTIVAVEDITSRVLETCPFPNSSGSFLYSIPAYRVEAPGVLSLGPGTPGGMGGFRQSDCNDASVPDGGDPIANDPLFFKDFSDLHGRYLGAVDLPPDPVTGEAVSVPSVFILNVHVRGLDHA